VFTARYEFHLCIQIHGGRSPPFCRGAHLRSQVSPYEISGGQRDTGTDLFPEYFGFSLSVSFPPILRTHLTYTSHLLEGQTGETWEPSKKQCSFGNREALDRKVKVKQSRYRPGAAKRVPGSLGSQMS